MKTKNLDKQSVLITGGSTGIGKATARALLEAGYGTVLIASRNSDRLKEVQQTLQSEFTSKRILCFAFDLRKLKETEALLHFVRDQVGVIDVLINNSGLAVAESIYAITDDGWDQVIETNLRGAMWLMKQLVPQMIEQDFGDIINISSQAGKNGYADVPAYCASKYGLLGLADAVRDHVLKANANVRVVNLCPALVDVETSASMPPRTGFLHVRAMTQTILFALRLDRNVILHDIGLMGR